jgi:sporulation protein YlmC with PRC-barrel domain
MKSMNRGLLLAGAISVIAALQVPALAQDTTAQPATTANATTNLGTGAVDAGKLIGEDVIDAKGDTVGEIESVIVNPNGKVSSVVLNVGGWLSSDKRISVAWKDLRTTADGKITSSLTKESAQAAAGYSYKQDTLRGKVLSETGQLFGSNSTDASKTEATGTTSTTTNSSTSLPSAQNTDGSFNASQVVGLSVVNNADDKIGKISELLVDQNGKINGVIVDVGGFLGIGTHPVKLGWNQIRLINKDGTEQAVVNMNKDALKQMPEYNATNG